jgi:phosphonate transport system substrate-binding protein
LTHYLSATTGETVTLSISKNYQDHIHRLGKGELDLAFLGPASYVKLVDAYGEKPILARLEIEGKPSFRGAIVIRADSPFRRLTDLEGRRFAFGDPSSTMSHLVPRFVMWKAGVTVEAFSGYEHLDGHHNVALGVLLGDFDAGAVKEEVLDRYAARGLKALAYTPPVSEHLFVASSSLPEAMRKRLRDALIDLSDTPEGRNVIHGIKAKATGLAPAVASDYENLRLILQELRRQGVEF